MPPLQPQAQETPTETAEGPTETEAPTEEPVQDGSTELAEVKPKRKRRKAKEHRGGYSLTTERKPEQNRAA